MSSPPNRYAQIELAIDIVANFEKVLDGLKAWQRLGLIDRVDLRFQTQQAYASYTRLKVEIKPELLEGLEQWLNLGILSTADVVRFCGRELTCDRVESMAPQASPSYISTTSMHVSTPPVSNRERAASEIPAIAETVPVTQPPTPITPLGEMAKSLVAEFSLVWLLFLGVFLVVVSSGVLAATQWDRFSAQGQYLILFAYTLAFWGVSFWTLKQGNLLLTTRTLQLVTLLIVPANFWAIDGLGLLNNPIGIGIGAIAGVSLSGITVYLLRQAGTRTSNLAAIGLILLSWLHLGWGMRFYPAIAVYLGIVSMAIALLPQQSSRRNSASTNSPTGAGIGFPIHLIASGSAIVLLVVRSLLFADVRLSQLGLAFGLCGLILHLMALPKQPQQNQSDPQFDSQPEPGSTERSNLSIPQVQANQNLGIGLLVIGWLVSVGEIYPWQALIISCIALVLLADRLLTERSQHTPTKTQLTAIFLLGLQTIALCVPFIPPGVKDSLVEWAARLTNTSTGTPMLGVVFIPYVWLTLWFANRLRSRRHNDLARHGEVLALLFGGLLTYVSLFSPLTRTLDLLLSASTLLVLERREKNIEQAVSGTGLIYLAHITGLGAIASAIDYFLPKLDAAAWIGIILSIVLVEWGNVFYQGRRSAQINAQLVGIASGSQRSGIWSDSSWNIGLCLAGLSYIAILGLTYQWLYLRLGDGLSATSSNLRVLWLVIPAALTFLGSRRYLRQAQLATDCSITALILAQVLMWDAPDSLLLSLGAATILMLFNIRQSEHLSTAWFTVGLGLGFMGTLLWLLKQNDPLESQLAFYTNGAAASVLILFLLGHWLRNRQKRAPSNLDLPLNQMYVRAFDLWAIPISLIILTCQTLAIFPVWGMAPAIAADWIDRAFTQTLFSTAAIAGATIYRIWQAPAPWVTWIVAWSAELLILRGVIAANGTNEHAGIANLAVGLAMQLGGDWLYVRRGMRSYPVSWQAMPLACGFLGWIFSLSTFSAVSGLYSLAAVLIFIGIGRREAESNSGFRSLIYLSVAGITFSLYQLLIYQLFRASGGSWGDGLILMGSLSAAIAVTYRTCARWLNFYLKLSIHEIARIAHLHWFAGAALLLTAAVFSPSQTGGWLGCMVLVVLAIYAAWQGRNRASLPGNLSEPIADGISIPTARKEAWVYASVITAMGALVFLIYFAFPESKIVAAILRPYGSILACIIAYGLFVLPWWEWGWSPRPWRRSAGCLPLVMVILTADTATVPSLLVVATFYAAIARLYNAIRLTYISVILSNWALFRFYHSQDLTHSLWYVLALGMSALYLIQVEPSLRSAEARETRHTFRLFAAGSIGLTALLHSPSDLPMSLVAAAIAIVFVISGLALRVRAYLFVGTITFIAVVLMQVLSLIAQYSFLIWAILICAGIALILIVANFEARRDRMLALWRGLIGELSTWD
ncbi:hypothetical protein [Pseudanabaena sp. PCC 6802]|uniref:hypothetical protein n=1 Tax=Pseudanabaena sp. PCC 6802 TaxID=118173 RepID=UPI00034B1BB2|nr:hypothetical protein [Pseudanabaena sp. PCC 6802]